MNVYKNCASEKGFNGVNNNKNSSIDEISEREPVYDDIAHVLQNTKKTRTYLV